LAAYKDAAAKWDKDVGATYNPQLTAWKDEVARDQLAGLPLPPKPQPSVGAPVAPVPPEGTTSTPTSLFNGMIAPMIPFGIKGVIWYQGESNAGPNLEYKTLFPALITDWRQHWGEGNFPFIFEQISSFKASCWPLIRESQLDTLCLPNTGMAVAIDIGDPGGPIHPIDKSDVGYRLSLVARHVAYAQDLVYSGPIYASMKVEDNSVRLNFTQVGGGLIIGSAPWVASDQKPVPTDKLYGFAIAGADKNWFAADAKIDGTTVVVSSPKVAQPVAVRYAWAGAPKCNLYNKEGLPASPFRTDDWTDALGGKDFLPTK
jgi:sialate O-acetylesterase